jgi:hypothetical protein
MVSKSSEWKCPGRSDRPRARRLLGPLLLGGADARLSVLPGMPSLGVPTASGEDPIDGTGGPGAEGERSTPFTALRMRSHEPAAPSPTVKYSINPMCS